MPLPPTADASSRLPALVLAAALLGGLAVAGWQVVQQVRMAPSSVPSSVAAAPKNGARETRTVNPSPEPSGPGWAELSTSQKQALYPLAERWATMGEAPKRRWLALAQTFGSLPPQEQAKLHSRMADWANLSAQQRSQARLNYAVTKRLAPDDKRAQWEAYQALSEEEKHLLAARAAPKPSGAATALRPVSPKKLARVPAATAAQGTAPNLPKIPPVADQHPRPALPVPQPAPPVETRPATPPPAVETAPVAVPSATPAPLPPLAPAPNGEPAPPSTVEPPPTPNPNPYPQR